MNESYTKGRNVALNKALEFVKGVSSIHKRYINETDFSLKNHINQICRISSSVAANLAEIVSSLSTKHKISKINICLGECRESRIWLEILQYNEMLTEAEYNYLTNLCDEIYRILNATLPQFLQVTFPKIYFFPKISFFGIRKTSNFWEPLILLAFSPFSFS